MHASGPGRSVTMNKRNIMSYANTGSIYSGPPILPPNMNSMDDGVHVFMDTRMERSTQVESVMDMIHGDAEFGGNANALASMFVTVRETNRMGEEIMQCGTSSIVCKGSFTSSTFSHAVIKAASKVSCSHSFHSSSLIWHHHHGITIMGITIIIIPKKKKYVKKNHVLTFYHKQDRENVDVHVQFVCSDGPAEEGEIIEASFDRFYTLCVRTNASFMSEIHRDSDTKYIHGMRKLIAHIGWAMSRTPTCNMRIPLTPPGERDTPRCRRGFDAAMPRSLAVT